MASMNKNDISALKQTLGIMNSAEAKALYSPVKRFSRNIIGRDFVCGDIHGQFALLRKKLDELHFDYSCDRLFSVGDNIDGGEQSSDVFEYLEKDWFYTVRGNHEQLLIDSLHDPITYAFEHVANGGGWFWNSFLPTALHDKETLASQLTKLDRLPYAIEIDQEDRLVGIVHADVWASDWARFVTQISTQRNKRGICKFALTSECRAKKAMLNGAPRDMSKKIEDACRIKNVDAVFVGHTITNGPYKIGNMHFIDTGAKTRDALTIIQL